MHHYSGCGVTNARSGPRLIVGSYDDQPAQAGQATQGVGGNAVQMRVHGEAHGDTSSCCHSLGSQLVLYPNSNSHSPGRHPAGVPAAGCACPPQPAAVLLPDGEMRPPPPSAARWTTMCTSLLLTQNQVCGRSP